MSYVLAIEPHREQASRLRDTVAARARATLTIVGSIGDAMATMDVEIPKLVLVSALISPRDERLLIARLRDLPNAIAPQVLFVPPLAALDSCRRGRTLIDRFWRRSKPPTACCPVVFGDQLSTYLRRRRRNQVPRVSTSAATDRRASFRLEHIEWARVLINGAAANVVDLSLRGAQIVSSMVLPPRRSVEVTLSNEADTIRCEGGIVWSAFEMIGPEQGPFVRAGLNFKDVDREAIEALCVTRDHTDAATAAAPQEALSVIRKPADSRRPRAERWTRADVPWLFTVKFPWGVEGRPLNISNSGLLLESGSKVTPGSIVELKLCGPEWQIAIAARFVRSEVAVVDGLGVRYHSAAAFEKPLEFPRA